MKKNSFLASLLCACFLVTGSGLQLTFAQNKSESKDSATTAQDDKDRRLAAEIRKLTDRTMESLVVKKAANGITGIEFQEGFQNVMISKMDDDGDLNAACVTSLAEANAFFGKNLETGAAVPQTYFEKDKGAELAARHGMSQQEFEFYSKMIEQAAQQRVLYPDSATINIVNGDGAGEGFNDATAKAVEGGNNGATLGQQRLNLFNFAAGIWSAYLDTSVPININSQFNSLTPCTTSGGVLGSAGATGGYTTLPNEPYAFTIYHTALANKISGIDVNGAAAEINARFNTDVDNGCLGAGTRFYYGLNNSTPGGTVNLLVVLLHEMGHGLGFSSFVNGTTGQMPSNLPDVYLRFMYDRTTNKYWAQMSDAERAASALNVGNVLWDGANVKIASGFLTGGRDAATGRVQLYTPNPYEGGSSISHFDTASSPNLLMEPMINAGLPTDLDLTRQVMRDIGWYRDTNADMTPDTITNVSPNSGTRVVGNNYNVTWTNNGGFNRNVTIELSTDGGATYPTTIASNVANTGSYTFSMPNLPTTQARLRVREYNFVAPTGASSGNFTITTVSAATVSVGGRVLTSKGRPIARARVTMTTAAGETRTVLTNSFGYYRFAGVPAGSDYVFEVTDKRYEFAAQSLFVSENNDALDFTALQ